MIRSAKETFVSGVHRKSWEEITMTESFRAACDYALLVMLEGMDRSSDPAKGWDSACQLTGARKVLDNLKNLHEPIEDKIPEPAPSLKYNIPNKSQR